MGTACMRGYRPSVELGEIVRTKEKTMNGSRTIATLIAAAALLPVATALAGGGSDRGSNAARQALRARWTAEARFYGRNDVPGLGVWKQNPNGRVRCTFVLFSFDAAGHRAGTITATTLGRISDGVLRGSFTANGVDLAGNTLAGFPKTGTYGGKRIETQAQSLAVHPQRPASTAGLCRSRSAKGQPG